MRTKHKRRSIEERVEDLEYLIWIIIYLLGGQYAANMGIPPTATLAGVVIMAITVAIYRSLTI